MRSDDDGFGNDSGHDLGNLFSLHVRLRHQNLFNPSLEHLVSVDLGSSDGDGFDVVLGDGTGTEIGEGEDFGGGDS